MLHHHSKKPHHTFMYLWVLGGVLVLVSGMVGYALNNPTTALAPEPVAAPVSDVGTTTLMLSVGESATMFDSTIVIDRVAGDSRCPSDVQCIQAGTIELSATVTGPNGTSTLPLALGVVSTTEHLQVTFTEAIPAPLSTTPIETSQYRFTLLIEKR